MEILYSEIGDKKCKLHTLKCRPKKINQKQQLIQINVENNDIQVIDQVDGMVIVPEQGNDQVVMTEQVYLSTHTTHQPNIMDYAIKFDKKIIEDVKYSMAKSVYTTGKM